MFPSWDSLSELEQWHRQLGSFGFWVPIVFGFLILVLTAGWGTYNKKVENRISELRQDQENNRKRAVDQEIEEAKRTADEAKQQAPVRTGFLIPGNGDTQIPSNVPKSATVFFLGDTIVSTVTFPLVIIRQQQENILTVGKEKEGIYFSGKFFSEEGKIICEIVKNEFHLNVKNYFRIEKTDHRLTVFDEEARVAIDIEFINERSIRLLGNFHLRNGKSIILTETAAIINGNLFAGNVFNFAQGDEGGAIFSF